MNNNPFRSPKTGYSAQSAEDRIDRVMRMDKSDLEAALNVPGIQKTVVNKIRSRLSKIEQDEQHG